MKEPELSKGLQYIDDDLIAEAMEESEIKNISSWNACKRLISVAAVIALMIVGMGSIYFITNRDEQDESDLNVGEVSEYRDITLDVPISENENGYFIYSVIPEVNDYNDDLYGGINKTCLLRRNCWPIFSHGNRISFSGTSSVEDSDSTRYQEWVVYLGKTEFCPELLNATKSYHTTESVECLLIQHDYDKETEAVGLKLYLDGINTTELYLMMSKDFLAIKNEDVRKEIAEFKNVDVNSISIINNQMVCIKYIGRQRGDNVSGQEMYTYYAYWENDDIEYLLQFDTIYMCDGISGYKQEYRKAIFEEILVEILQLTT